MDIDSSLKQNFDQARNALDLNGLNAIRQQSRESDGEAKQAALKEAAQQFEAIFMKMLLSSMRKAQDVLESDSPFNSQSTKFYRDMHDQQMAVELSSNGSLGLSDLIVRQLGGDSDNFKPSSVLRNDGSLSINPTLTNNDKNNQTATVGDKLERNANKDNESPTNSLVEKMLASGQVNQINQAMPGNVPVPYNNSVQGVNAVNQLHTTASNKTRIANANVKNSTPSVNSNFNEPKDFVSALKEPAQKVEQTLGVPFEVVIAQAALETGWGQKIITDSNGESSNNLFNIKADSRWAGEKVAKDTLEFENGAMVKKLEPFRTYETITQSIDDYINFLSTSDRYQDALQDSSNVEHFLQGLQKAGYATDPQYADKILGTLKTVTNLLAK